MSVPWEFFTTDADTGIPNVPTPEGRELGAHMARFADVEAAKDPARDERCDECAFRLGTNANGCPGTLMDATKCVIERVPFYCHKSGEPVCSGYALLVRAKGER